MHDFRIDLGGAMKGLLFLCGWLLMAGATAWAYEEIQVTDGEG